MARSYTVQGTPAADNGATVTVASGALITLSLQTNSSTGFQWLSLSPLAPSVLQLLATTLQSPLVVRLGMLPSPRGGRIALGSGTTTLSLACDHTLNVQSVPAYSLTVSVP